MRSVLSFPAESQGPASGRPSFSQVTAGAGTPATTQVSSSGAPTATATSVGWDASSIWGGSARRRGSREGSSLGCSPGSAPPAQGRHAPITRRLKALLVSPASFEATQAYTPVSAGPTAPRLSRGPSATRSLGSAGVSPSFSQVTAGAGDPLASQAKVTSEPVATTCSSLLSGLSRTGGAGDGAISLAGSQALGMVLASGHHPESTRRWLSLLQGFAQHGVLWVCFQVGPSSLRPSQAHPSSACKQGSEAQQVLCKPNWCPGAPTHSAPPQIPGSSIPSICRVKLRSATPAWLETTQV